MRLPPFALEQFFARYEFTVAHLLCASDVDGIALRDLLALADEDSRARYERLTLGYTEAWGDPTLRETIAKDYRTLDKDHVLIANPQEAIFLTMNTLLGPGDHVIVGVPAYQSLYEVARATGADVTLLPLDPERRYELDPEALRKAVRANTRLIVVNYPHNPSGALIDAATQRAIMDIAREAKAHVFFDEVYRFLEHDPQIRLPPAADLYERAISYTALSKAYGLAGLRIGWLATQDRALLERIQVQKDYTTICQSGPSEALALCAVRARDALVARSRAIIDANKVLFDTFFRRHADHFSWHMPRAASVALVDLSEPADAFVERVVQATGVLLMPGSAFGIERSCVRIGLGRSNTKVGLEKLDAFLRS